MFDPETKIWSANEKSSIYNKKASVGEIILYALERNLHKVCEISDDYGSILMCCDVRKQSIQVAQNLMDIHGIKPNDICAVVSKNNPEVSSVVFGCLFIGAPVNCLDPSFDLTDFDHMLGLTKPKVIFAEENVLEQIQKSVKKLKLELKIFCFTDKERNSSSNNEILSVASLFTGRVFDDYIPVHIPDTSQHIAFVACSSGTTGLAKGVCLSHAQIISQKFRFWPVQNSDVTLTFSSLYWVTGLASLLVGVVEGNIRVITSTPFTPKYFVNLIEKYRITHTFIAPALIAACLEEQKVMEQANLSSLRIFLTGGSPLLPQIQTEFEKYLRNGVKIKPTYGMTELCTTCTINLTSRSGSVGPPWAGHKFKILSKDGKQLGPNEEGEVCILPPLSFLGYYGNENELKSIRDDEGWLHSGDMGYFDDNGYLFIVGRKKEIIKYQNYQIAPVAIETIIQQTTGLTQVCVVPVEDLKHGTELVAAVCVLPNKFHLTKTQLHQTLDENLTDMKKLRGGFYFVDKLPKTASGKVLRRVVKQTANELYHQNKFYLIFS